jgi:DNA-binding IscR family transcriptional regulator
MAVTDIRGPAGGKALARQLKEVVLQLRQIQSAVVVAAAALKRQNAELDEDVANVLQSSAVDKIEDQIERLEELILAMARSSSRPRTPGSNKRRKGT